MLAYLTSQNIETIALCFLLDYGMLFILKVQNTVDVVCSADPFTAENQEPLFTFTIITTESSKGLSFLHDRMPVILTSTEDIELWLSASDWSRNLCKLICPNESEFDWYVLFLWFNALVYV